MIRFWGEESPPLEFVVSGSMGTVLLGQHKENTAHEKYLLMKEESAAISFVLFFFNFIYLFNYGCVGSSSLCEGFL